MDPDENLREQLELAKRITKFIAHDHDPSPALPDAERLAELVLALDAWIHRGGFLPRQWKEKTHA